MKRVKPEDVAFNEVLLSIPGSQSQRALHQKMRALIAGQMNAKSVLEAGCGRGAFTRKILKESPSKVVACDINPASLAKVDEIDSDVLETKLLDLRDPLDFIDGHFGWIVCSSVLMHLEPDDSAYAIKEFARVLVPGGKFIIAVLHEDFAAAEYQRATEYGAYARAVSGSQAAPSIIEYYPEVQHYRDALGTAGLSFTEHIVFNEEQAVRESEPLWRIFAN